MEAISIAQNQVFPVCICNYLPLYFRAKWPVTTTTAINWANLMPRITLEPLEGVSSFLDKTQKLRK